MKEDDIILLRWYNITRQQREKSKTGIFSFVRQKRDGHNTEKFEGKKWCYNKTII